MKYDEKLNMSLLFDFYGDILTDRQKEIASLSFDEDLSLREISEITGITPQGVRDSLNKCKTILTDMEEKLGLLSKFTQNKTNTDYVISRLVSMKEKNPQLSDEIDGIIAVAEKMLD
ncbi:MAG: DNA-binding protein [Clostridia bacterium]|nr:DNA-binding protein [Clostridia bacterium]